MFAHLRTRTAVVATSVMVGLLGLGGLTAWAASAAINNAGCISAKDPSHVVHAFSKCPAGYYAANLAGLPGPAGPKGDPGIAGPGGSAGLPGSDAASAVRLLVKTVDVLADVKATAIPLPTGSRILATGFDSFTQDPKLIPALVVKANDVLNLETPKSDANFTFTGNAAWPAGVKVTVTVWAVVLVR